MLLLDRGGTLRAALGRVPREAPLPSPEERLMRCERFANWLLLAHHTTERGGYLRAADALGHAQRHLTWMARLAQGRTRHWLTPSRRAECELPGEVAAGLAAATAGAEPAVLRGAFRAAWRLGRDCWRVLAARQGAACPEALFAALDARFG